MLLQCFCHAGTLEVCAAVGRSWRTSHFHDPGLESRWLVGLLSRIRVGRIRLPQLTAVEPPFGSRLQRTY
jgi:hypothetical protein